jgi:hypothetical protein
MNLQRQKRPRVTLYEGICRVAGRQQEEEHQVVQVYTNFIQGQQISARSRREKALYNSCPFLHRQKEFSFSTS